MIQIHIERSETLSYWVRSVREWINDVFDHSFLQDFIPVIEVVSWAGLLIILDFICQRVFGFILQKLVSYSKLKWDDTLYKHKVFRSLIHFIPAGIAYNLNPYVFQHYDGIDTLANKIIGFIFIVLFIVFISRLIDAIIDMSKDDNSYTTIGVRTFGQLIKVTSVFAGIIVGIALLLDVKVAQILTVMGALTAVILLIFRDSILGFVSGLQISTSKTMKVGDWVSIPKYNLEGTVKEINLSIVKIERFDKTISTVPTYDLISTEVVNYSMMTSTNTRRIKRSILFNVNSFKICSEEMLEKFEKLDLISDYIKFKREEIKEHNILVKNKELTINGQSLTNIGVFRKYAQHYLLNHPSITNDSHLMVRQLEPESLGMPLEIYCFTNTSDWLEYERIQSDIFDHLLSACKEFDLKISQPFIIQNNHD